jgi:hypothetical protein
MAGRPGTFTSTADLPDRRFRLNTGVSLLTTKSLDIRLEYSGEYASGYSSNTGSVEASYLF